MAHKNTHDPNKNTSNKNIREEISEYDYLDSDEISEYDYLSPEEVAELDIDEMVFEQKAGNNGKPHEQIKS